MECRGNPFKGTEVNSMESAIGEAGSPREEKYSSDEQGQPQSQLTSGKGSEVSLMSEKEKDAMGAVISAGLSESQHNLQIQGQVEVSGSSGIRCPSLMDLTEFRYDMTHSACITDNQFYVPTETTVNFNFGPNQPTVFTVMDSVVHYYSASCSMYIGGEWATSTIQIPVAQHLCISLDDGIKRYEEVIKIEMLKTPIPMDANGVVPLIITPVEYRLLKGNPAKRQRFRDILKRSLLDSLRTMTDEPYEMIISRATGRHIHLDNMINQYFNEARPGCELYISPIFNHVQQHMEFALTGTPLKLVGMFHRPVLVHAVTMLTSSDTQLFETVAINIYPNERKIIAVAFDSAVANITEGMDHMHPSSICFVDGGSYTDCGPTSTGLNIIAHNPRVRQADHPFCNLSKNPAFNRTLNPYHSPAFQPPPFVPLNMPIPHPFGFPFVCPLINTNGQMMMPVHQPCFPIPGQMPGQVPLPMIGQVPFQVGPSPYQGQIFMTHPQQHHGLNQLHPPTSTPPPSPREQTQKSVSKESCGNLRLNPNAKDFYPPGYSMIHLPMPTGPVNINVGDMATECDEPVLISSFQQCPPLSAIECEAFQVQTIHRLQPGVPGMQMPQQCDPGQDHVTEPVKTVFLNTSESHCSLYDPDTTLEITASRFQGNQSQNEAQVQGQNYPQPPPASAPNPSRSWSEEVEGGIDDMTAVNGGAGENCQSYYNMVGSDGRGGGYRRPVRGYGRGYRGTQEEWSRAGGSGRYVTRPPRGGTRTDFQREGPQSDYRTRTAGGYSRDYNSDRRNYDYSQGNYYSGRGRGRGSGRGATNSNYTDGVTQAEFQRPWRSGPREAPAQDAPLEEEVPPTRSSYATATKINIPEDKIPPRRIAPPAQTESADTNTDEEISRPSGANGSEYTSYRGRGRGRGSSYRGCAEYNRSPLNAPESDANEERQGSYRNSKYYNRFTVRNEDSPRIQDKNPRVDSGFRSSYQQRSQRPLPSSSGKAQQPQRRNSENSGNTPTPGTSSKPTAQKVKETGISLSEFPSLETAEAEKKEKKVKVSPARAPSKNTRRTKYTKSIQKLREEESTDDEHEVRKMIARNFLEDVVPSYEKKTPSLPAVREEQHEEEADADVENSPLESISPAEIEKSEESSEYSDKSERARVSSDWKKKVGKRLDALVTVRGGAAASGDGFHKGTQLDGEMEGSKSERDTDHGTDGEDRHSDYVETHVEGGGEPQ